MYTQVWASRFKKDVKRCQKQNKSMEKFKEIARLLSSGESLPLKNRDHSLTGNYIGYRECHISPDWLLIYRINDTDHVIEFVRMGSHSELFD